MVLYTCGQKTKQASLGHPCGKAGRALDQAGIDYELKTVPGYRMLPWTRKAGMRDEIKRLSGQENVPILVLDDGEVISGSGDIVRWAKEREPASASG
jgi:glutathione S-transferase